MLWINQRESLPETHITWISTTHLLRSGRDVTRGKLVSTNSSKILLRHNTPRVFRDTKVFLSNVRIDSPRGKFGQLFVEAQMTDSWFPNTNARNFLIKRNSNQFQWRQDCYTIRFVWISLFCLKNVHCPNWISFLLFRIQPRGHNLL